MIVHIVLFTWKDETGQSKIDALSGALAQLPGAIPEVLELRYGSDAGLRKGNADFAVIATFADQASWAAYQAHPAHVALVANHLTPIVASRCAIQFTPLSS